MTAAEIIATLGLKPHPEGGHYARTWRGPIGLDGRAIGSAIHYLLREGERSHWHRVDAHECWLFHGGSPLRLSIGSGHSETNEHTLGIDLAAGEVPQITVPPNQWQSAVTTGDWTLVSCVVTPGFEFEGFELAGPDQFACPRTSDATS
jgi:predicted cupin superfamily sugar epimerase